MDPDRKEWLIAVLHDLGWTEVEESGDLFTFNNPTLPEHVIGFDGSPDAEGSDLLGQLTRAGLEPYKLGVAISGNIPANHPYWTAGDF